MTIFEDRALERLSKEELLTNVIYLREALAAEQERRIRSDYERGALNVECQVLANTVKRLT